MWSSFVLRVVVTYEPSSSCLGRFDNAGFCRGTQLAHETVTDGAAALTKEQRLVSQPPGKQLEICLETLPSILASMTPGADRNSLDVCYCLERVHDMLTRIVVYLLRDLVCACVFQCWPRRALSGHRKTVRAELSKAR